MRYLFERVGFRGASLIFLGVVWFAIGARLFDGDPDPARTLPIEYLPVWLRVALWWGPCCAAIVTAWWPPGRTTWGFVLLIIPACLRGMSNLFSFILGVTVDPLFGWDLGYVGVWEDLVVWCGVSAYIYVLASWPEPPDTSEVEPSLHLPEIPPER